MENMTYSDFRSHLTSALDKVSDDHQPILVTRQSGKASVVMSLEDFKSYEEMAHLMASAENVARINRSIEELEKGKGRARKLIEK